MAGHPTGGGNPDWARQHPVPTRHAWAVQRLLDAGATLIGKTITDEVSLGILGENPFDGTPLNPAAPGHVPGGLLLGLGLGRRAGSVRHRARHRQRRLGARAGELLRTLRHPADPRPPRPHRHDGAGARLRHGGLVRAGRRDVRPRLRGAARRADRAVQPADHGRRGGRRIRPGRRRDRRGARTHGPLAGDAGGARARGSSGAAGAVGLGAGAADAPVQRGLADVQGLARSRQSAPGLQRGARPRRPRARSPTASASGPR